MSLFSSNGDFAYSGNNYTDSILQSNETIRAMNKKGYTLSGSIKKDESFIRNNNNEITKYVDKKREQHRDGLFGLNGVIDDVIGHDVAKKIDNVPMTISDAVQNVNYTWMLYLGVAVAAFLIIRR